MRAKPGTRVAVIRKCVGDTVFLYGYGTYEGDHLGSPLSKLLGDDYKSPKIVLDNGTVFWGYQCWWGEEERVKKEIIGERKVKIVPPRKQHQK